ncbi:hypothetical protein COV20_06245 [Candidatus Woesearchaeota archaeon CG10_big_fil_rev_8_21_14_0_10_45_16]|nr:MAG: hypothetical protein COV20_06245 [Candidatus Woesearchaeota archaeon CG10_big_fil_rev_8_21_14_0_10_45_16]
MDSDKNREETARCLVRKQHQGLSQEGKPYCRLYEPTNQRRDFECPVLEHRLVDVMKGEDLFSMLVPYWACGREQYGVRELREIYQRFKGGAA